MNRIPKNKESPDLPLVVKTMENTKEIQEVKKVRRFRRLRKISLWILGSVLGFMLLISGALYFFKDEICGYVITEVNKHLKAKVSVAKVDLAFWGSFPNLSVDFNEVFIQDAYLEASVRDTMLYTERIRLKFNPLDIWNEKYDVKQIEISPGTLQLKVNEKGEVNYDILKPSEDSASSAFKLHLEKVELENFRVSYKNQLTAQTYSSRFHELALEGDFTEKQFALKSEGRMKIRQVKSGTVPLISNKESHFDIVLSVDQNKGTVAIPKCLVYVSNLPFEVEGIVTPSDLRFSIKADNLELKDVANNFTHTSVENINKFGGSGKIRFDVSVSGELKTDAPTIIDCNFGVNNGSLLDPVKGLKLHGIRLEGKYSNFGGAEKEFLRLSDIAFVSPGGPFSGEVLLTEFDFPRIEGSAKGNLNLKVLQNLFPIEEIQDVEGNVQINTDFEVKKMIVDSTLIWNVHKCEGELEMKDVHLQLIDDKRNFRDVNGNVYLRNDEAGVEDFSLKVGTSDLLMNGVFKHLTGFIADKEKLQVDLHLESNFVNVQDLSTETKQEQIEDGRNWILPTKLNGEVTLNVNELKYEKHSFKDLRGTFGLRERLIHFPDLMVKNAGAAIRGGLIIEEKTPEIFTIATKAISDNVEIKPLFKEWDNFQQQVITENNIFGKIQAKLEFEAPFDLRSGIQMNAIKAKVQLKIMDGRLKNVTAFKSITESMKTSSAKFILNKASIDEFEKKLLDLRFGSFENTFIIRNGRLEIPSMNIESNALDVKLEGTHDFDNTIDYRFAFRFRDLKKKKEEEFGEVIDDGTGVKLFVRMYGTIDKPIIEWDESAKKQQAKENREQAKKDAKAILKSEFGFFKGDSTVKDFQPISKPKEELKIEFGPDKKEEFENQEKKKKNSKINKAIEKMKKESEKAKQEEFEVN